jgi:hypothetical protein
MVFIKLNFKIIKHFYILLFIVMHNFVFSQYKLNYSQSGFIHDGCNIGSDYIFEIGTKSEPSSFVTLESSLCVRVLASSKDIMLSSKPDCLRFRSENFISSEYTINYPKNSSCASASDFILKTPSDENVTISFIFSPYYLLNYTPDPSENLGNIGICDKIKIEAPEGYNSEFYNWKYLVENGNWTNISAFNGNNVLEIAISDLAGVSINTSIKFQLVNCKPSTIKTYSIIGCSPELAVNPPKTDSTRCKNDPSGSVTLEFKTELKDGDRFLFNLFRKTLTTEEFDKHIFVSKNAIKDNKYNWSELAEGTYIIKYQAQSTINENTKVGLSAITVNPFTIGSPAKLESEFKYLTDPLCHNDNGSITIKTTGGTGNYFYKINTDEVQQFEMTTTEDNITKIRSATQTIPLPSTTTTNYNILLTDEKGCIEKN